MTLPSNLTSDQERLWTLAYQSGFKCGRDSGYLEQVPYLLHEPLFDAWIDGWRDGILEADPDECAKVTSNIQQILNRRWLFIVKASRRIN